MKTTKKSAITIALFISVLICFQSCKVYYKDSVTLEQAVYENKRTKLETNDKQTFSFRSIIKENDNYFGMKKEKGEWIKIRLNQNDLEKVRLQNETMSTISTIGVTLLSIIGLLGVGGAIFLSGGII